MHKANVTPLDAAERAAAARLAAILASAAARGREPLARYLAENTTLSIGAVQFALGKAGRAPASEVPAEDYIASRSSAGGINGRAGFASGRPSAGRRADVVANMRRLIETEGPVQALAADEE